MKGEAFFGEGRIVYDYIYDAKGNTDSSPSSCPGALLTASPCRSATTHAIRLDDLTLPMTAMRAYTVS